MPVVARSPTPDYERSPSPERDDFNDGPGPSKRARMTVQDIQRRRLEKLLANPEKEVHLPASVAKSIREPKDILKNVTGSSAAAGSGEFHVYKNARRREAERVRFMETQARELEEQAAFLKRQAELDAVTEAKAAKNRAKRQKRKGKGGGAAAGTGAQVSAQQTTNSSGAGPGATESAGNASSEPAAATAGANETTSTSSTNPASSKFTASKPTPSSEHKPSEEPTSAAAAAPASAEVTITVVDED